MLSTVAGLGDEACELAVERTPGDGLNPGGGLVEREAGSVVLLREGLRCETAQASFAAVPGQSAFSSHLELTEIQDDRLYPRRMSAREERSIE
jgi:hypothetical protein